MTKKQIHEFLNRLNGKEGCNFRYEKTELIWNCKGGQDKTFSREILTKMKITKTEQDKFLEKCDKLGGHCDCEILFNSAEHLE